MAGGSSTALVQRLELLARRRAALLPNAAMIDRLASADNFDSLLVGRYQNCSIKSRECRLEQALPVLSRMHVGYLVSPRELDLPIVTRAPDVTIYRNDRVLPRAWIAPAQSDLNAVSEIAPNL